MEWIVLAAIAAAAAAYILVPRAIDREAPEEERMLALRAEREALLDQLRELDDDAAAGRITAADRADGRRALGPRLRTVTETLQQLGERRDPFRVVPSEEPAAEVAEPANPPELRAVESEPAEPRP